jgi:hypothetical protein
MNDLTPEEDLVLLGLMREIIQADGNYSEAEQREVGKLKSEMGDARFDRAVEGAKGFSSRGELKELAKTISRGAAQKAIFERLHALASADGISKNEEKPLEWLVHLWPKAQG